MDCGSGSKECYNTLCLFLGFITEGNAFGRFLGSDGRKPAIWLDSMENSFTICGERRYLIWSERVYLRVKSLWPYLGIKLGQFLINMTSSRKMIFS